MALACVTPAHSCSTVTPDRYDIVVVDRALDDYQSLIAGVIPGVEVIELDTQQDGIQQITQALAHRRGVSSLHIVSHGASGMVLLGNAELSLETLSRYAADLAIWSAALAPTAELLIYGCEVAKGERGQALIARLNKLTGASVAASATKTGCGALGGDWNLEVEIGKTTALAFQSEAMSAYAAVLVAGDLDPTFGTGGKVTTDFNNGYDEASDVVVQPDGKIVVVGSTDSSNGGGSRNYNFALARYNSDGSLDPTFGTGGKVTTDFADSPDFDYGSGVILQPDGKIVVSGSSNFFNLALSRYNSDGSLDPTFGTGGKVTTSFNSRSGDLVTGVTLQSDGKIVLAATTLSHTSDGGYNFTLTRYNSDGSLDNSFGNDGKVTTDFNGSSDGSYNVMQQSDGKLVVAGGSSDNNDSDADFALARYDSDGSLDNSFGNGGKVTTDFNGVNDFGTSAVLQSDGKIVVAGRTHPGFISIFEFPTPGVADFALARYNSDGSLDNSFGTGGKVTTDFSDSQDYGFGVTLQSDGKIVMVGTIAYIGSGGFIFALTRYNSDGSLDNSFGTGGKVTTNPGRFGGYGFGVTLQSDGKIVAVGSNGSDFAVVRYLGDPVDPSPTDLALSSDSIAENSNNGTVVGTLSTVDPNSSDTHTYTLLNNASGRFALGGSQRDQVVVADGALLNYEAATSHTIRIRTTDNSGLSYEDDLVIEVSNVNEAPNFTGNGSLLAINEDAASLGSKTVSQLFLDTGLFSDPDTGATANGVLVVGNTANATTQGSWQYSTDGTWFDINTVSSTVSDRSALALSQNAAIRFVPVANYNGTPPALTVRALDNTYSSGFTSGNTRTLVDATTNGGTTAISATTHLVTINIVPVNDAPALTGTPATLANGTEDTPYTIHQSDLVQGFTDVDGDTLSVSNLTATRGTLAHNNNGTYTLTPAANFNGPVTLNYTVIDGNGGSVAATTDLAIALQNEGALGGNRIFDINRGEVVIIDNFGGVGKETNPSPAIINEADTLRFSGAGLTGRNLLLTQTGAKLEITFAGDATTKVTLQNFQLENLDNLPSINGTQLGLGNILFDGETAVSPQDSLDVVDASFTASRIFNHNAVTFLNDLNNRVSGFNNSNDVINGQGGSDRIDGKGGNDLIRGGLGNDQLNGGSGNDWLAGGSGGDRFVYETGRRFRSSDVGVDTIADFASGTDKIVLDNDTFVALKSRTGKGFSLASEFAIVNSDRAAASRSALVVYNRVNGRLFYNQNKTSSGFGSGALFATLSNAPALEASDFVIQG